MMIDLDFRQLLANILVSYLWKRNPDLHACPHYLILLLQQFYALKCLFFRWLIQLNRIVNFLHGSFDRVQSKVSAVGWMNTLLCDNACNIGTHIDKLNLTFLIADLQLAYIVNKISPFSKIISIISSLSLFGKNLFKSDFLATMPWLAFS